MTKTVWVAAIAALAITPLIAKTGGGRGTNILHLNIKVPMTNTGEDTNNLSATGTVTATQATQGAADHESLTVSAKGLTPGEAYDVVGISNSTALPGGTFTANSKGHLNVKFGNGKKSAPVFADASQLQEVDLVDDTSNGPVTVLTGNITNATSLQYLVKLDISPDSGTNGVSATLQVKGTLNKGTSKSSGTVSASGLQAGAEYVLVFNGSPVATNAANSKGKVKITSKDTPPDILDLTSVDVTDTNSAPVTGTATLP